MSERDSLEWSLTPRNVSCCKPPACASAGQPYHFRTRDVEGDFHYRILRVHKEADGGLEVIGHWRSGAFDSTRDLHLVRSDGASIPITSLHVKPPVSEAAGRKGQRTLTGRTPQPDLFQANGCIRQKSAQLPIRSRRGELGECAFRVCDPDVGTFRWRLLVGFGRRGRLRRSRCSSRDQSSS